MDMDNNIDNNIDNDLYLDELNTNGFCKINNIFTENEIMLMTKIYSTSWNTIKQHWPTTWYHRKYLPMNNKYDNYIGTDLYNHTKIAYPVIENDNTTNNNMLINMGNGRYDFTYNLDIITKNIDIPQIITYIIQKTFKSNDYTYYYGGLPIDLDTNINLLNNEIRNGRWHRDCYSLFNIESIDLELPAFYYTILIPLCNNIETTEFIPGSHKTLLIDIDYSTSYIPVLNKGDICIFHGYTLHRGIYNNTIKNGKRDMLYIVCKKTWYNDEPPENYIETII